MALKNRDILVIRHLALKTLIGVYPHEKKIKQTVCVDLELEYDSSAASASDDLKKAWDYSVLIKDLKTMVESLQCNLIESLAQHICDHILKHYPCQHVRLTLIKPHALGGGTEVGLIVARER